MSKANWRVSPETGWVEIRTDEGHWINPDCAWQCPYCGKCLGCLRKMYDADLLDHLFDCPASPDGNHHLIQHPERPHPERLDTTPPPG